RVIAALEHPHILPVYDFGRHQGQTYLVMRYIEGGTLHDVLHRGALPPARVADLIDQIAGALDYAHQRGIVHRDIKPSNILLDRAGNAYVADFGIAKTMQETAGLTGTGTIGTPDYMPPEQAQGRAVDVRTDVYALGVMVFQMATGRLPFMSRPGDAVGVIYKHITELPPAPSTLNSTLRPELDGVILKALAKDPNLRYQSAGALARAVRSALETDAGRRAAPSARPEAAPAPPPRATLSAKLFSVALAGGLSGAAMFVAGLLLALAGAFTRVSLTGGATVTIEDIGTPLVAAFTVGLTVAGLRLMRVALTRTDCLIAVAQAALGLAIGVLAALLGSSVFLLVTPNRSDQPLFFWMAGAVLAVYSLFGFSMMGFGAGAGAVGPMSRQRPWWQNGLAIIVPLALGLIATASAALANYEASENIFDFIRVQSFFWAEPVAAMAGLAVAEWLWKYPLDRRT
ncbi:MAG: serine/threonine protein kinase, partial [Chloroflexi bacterium]|nr:serine/threonine protein kinase [Chloroflexota bacterium]